MNTTDRIMVIIAIIVLAGVAISMSEYSLSLTHKNEKLERELEAQKHMNTNTYMHVGVYKVLSTDECVIGGEHYKMAKIESDETHHQYLMMYNQDRKQFLVMEAASKEDLDRFKEAP